MDPTANLKEQRELAAQINATIDAGDQPDLGDILRLSELVLTLDEWISRGGFLPEQWRTP